MLILINIDILGMVGFDTRGSFSLPDSSGSGKNVIVFVVEMSSTAFVVDILILSKSPMQGLDDTLFTAEKEYTINFTEQHKKICLNLDYYGVNSYLFVNGVKTFWN